MSYYEDLRAALHSQATDTALLKISDFIIYAVESGNHADIAREFVDKKRTLSAIFEQVKKKAQAKATKGCAMIAAPDVYEWIAEILGLRDCITRGEIDRFCLGQMPAPEAAPEPPKPAGVDLGLDDLFG